MIIDYPTGFYRTVLPQSASDSTSVTYTISNSAPPRTELLFPQIPGGIESRQRLPELGFDRRVLGDLIFSVSYSDRSEIDSNARLLEIGDVLEFNDGVPSTTDPMLVGDLTEVRHDTNKFDYEAFGLTEADVGVLESATAGKMLQLQDQLNLLKRQRANSEQVISEQQKLINDLDRNIAALELITDDVTSADDDDILLVLNKLKLKRQTAFVIRDEAKQVANESAGQASIIINELRAMSAVVK